MGMGIGLKTVEIEDFPNTFVSYWQINGVGLEYKNAKN